MKTDKISFGTNPYIFDTGAYKGLPKYKKTLTEGIIDAFVKLSHNNTDDKLFLNIMPKFGAKRPTTDIIEISYHPIMNEACQSSIVISPKSLEKKSKKHISKLLINIYEELKKSNQQIKTSGGDISGTPKKISKKHSKLLDKLNPYLYSDLIA